jgi:hypothetical protein
VPNQTGILKQTKKPKASRLVDEAQGKQAQLRKQPSKPEAQRRQGTRPRTRRDPSPRAPDLRLARRNIHAPEDPTPSHASGAKSPPRPRKPGDPRDTFTPESVSASPDERTGGGDISRRSRCPRAPSDTTKHAPSRGWEDEPIYSTGYPLRYCSLRVGRGGAHEEGRRRRPKLTPHAAPCTSGTGNRDVIITPNDRSHIPPEGDDRVYARGAR